MYLEQQVSEMVAAESEPTQSPGMPSPMLMDIASAMVVSSLLVHRTAEERERLRGEFHSELTQVIKSDPQAGLLALAGLKAAGLGHKESGSQIVLEMRHPRLTNPDPAEFSTHLKIALPDSENAVKMTIKRGKDDLAKPEDRRDIKYWLENMETALKNVQADTRAVQRKNNSR